MINVIRPYPSSYSYFYAPIYNSGLSFINELPGCKPLHFKGCYVFLEPELFLTRNKNQISFFFLHENLAIF